MPTPDADVRLKVPSMTESEDETTRNTCPNRHAEKRF